MKFKVFICAALTISVILQAAIAGALWYGASKLKNSTHNVQTSLNQDTANINNNLTGIKTQLQQLNQTPAIP